MSGFFERAFFCDKDVTAVTEVNSAHFTEISYHIRNVVFFCYAKRTAAKCDSVVRTVNKFAESFKVFFACDNSRESENRPRRVVRMYSHFNFNFFCYFDYSFKEVFEVVPQIFFCNVSIFIKYCFKAFFCVAGTGQSERGDLPATGGHAGAAGVSRCFCHCGGYERHARTLPPRG